MSELRVMRIDAPPAEGCTCKPAWRATEHGPRAVPCACGGGTANAENADGEVDIVTAARRQMIERNNKRFAVR